MDESGRFEQDPVCGMMVNESENQLLYRGVGYAFCSQQCRERFASAPGLYVGHHGMLAPKQKGIALIKRRVIELGVALPRARFAELKAALLSMMGVIAVRPVTGGSHERRELQWIRSQPLVSNDVEGAEIRYDLLQATAIQLERRIVELDATLSNRWGERLRRDFIHYLEQCELDDLVIRHTDPARADARPNHTVSALYARTGPRAEKGTRDPTR